ncbi:Suppression of tumorigenicity 5 [Trypanosoma rangeli]|uniref:Suppression of tumorigenicity 5 n=1 Tax=Trypanosoma rangeli TaxID=5698 RepID=A0A3R7NUK9_TRYRA|nr:Suppression of tumorigenicity 5 [Trypanosoma rangeli]RNF12027.1 Suppression of tumorigenicity 5 [Trypanosoma rangeli]|eukprot:RNF12027.1 Suppression of tumorigenicity 5 [Trypanosoma rangeli]
MAIATAVLQQDASELKDSLAAPKGTLTQCRTSSARHGGVHPFSCHGGSEESCLLFFFILRKKRRDVEAVWSFPLPFEAVEARYPMLTQFVYTNAGTSYSAEELSHTFVLTDGRGVRVYGHCTAFVNGESVVSLSPYPWCRFFTYLATLFRTNGYENGEMIVKALYNCPTPPSGGTFALPEHIPISFQRPYDRLCSFIDTSPVYLLTIFPNTGALFSVLADLLLEKRVIVVGPNFGLVSQVVMSLQSLISPFDWMHILIPILPSTLLDVLAAPTPYLVGILTSQLPLLEAVPIESCVMIHLGSSGTCERVYYHNEEKHELPHSGTFSSLRIGYLTLKMQDPRDQTAQDLCSLFLTYYAMLLGDIGVCGAVETHITSTGNPEDIFYRLLMSTQCYNALIETVQEAFAGEDHDWMDNEFFVALVRGHAKVYPQHYQQLIYEEKKGGGYTTRHADCFGSREELTALSAMIHGFGGHRMSTGRLCCQCLGSLLCRVVCLKSHRALVTLEASVPPMAQRDYLSTSLGTPEDLEMVVTQTLNGTKCPSP